MRRSRQTFAAGLIAFCSGVLPILCLALEEDPWPFWGRTPTRIGNTTTIGPQTPAIEWSLSISEFIGSIIMRGSPVMDSAGRILVPTPRGMAAVDSHARELLWLFEGGEGPPGGGAVRNGRIVWADTHPFSTIYCFDAATGEPIWTKETDGSFNTGPVISDDDIVFAYDNAGDRVYALNLEDGSEVWTTVLTQGNAFTPSLEEDALISVTGTPGPGTVNAINPLNGSIFWQFGANNLVLGHAAITDGRIYFASWDHFLYCVDSATGDLLWMFDTEQLNQGAVAIGHNDVIYTATTGNIATLYAVSREGKENWRFLPDGDSIFRSPVVGGDELIYFTSLDSGLDIGWVYALNPDGTLKWVQEMPERCAASPMLAPDGTLYIVCSDKRLYAFRDPSVDATLDSAEVTFGTLLSGDESDLLEPDDDETLITRSSPGFNASEPNRTDLLLTFTNSAEHPFLLDVTIKSHINHPIGMMRLWVNNWTTNQFDEVLNAEITTESRRRSAHQLDPASYIRESDGRVEVRVRHVVLATFTASGFQSFFDHTRANVRNVDGK